MVRRTSVAIGDRISCCVAESLDLSSGPELDPTLFEVCREFAFSSDHADDFAIWYLRSQCLSKFQDCNPGTRGRREAAALSGFLDSEERCRVSNGRLVDTWSRARLNQPVWRRARVICAQILSPNVPWESLPWACAFGPGASGSLRRRESSHQQKWVRSTQITERALPYYLAFRRWAGSDLPLPSKLTIVRGNRVSTVPKSWKTDRCIAIEPDWNMFLQKGVGALIRRRLQRHGQLLPDAQERNKASARQGSEDGSLATLDMSAASDSISLALCEALLPEAWFRLVADLRSPEGEVAGTAILYEKISSMGNGYTFELETLLFYCLVLAACSKENWDCVNVYGDDIICHSADVPAVLAILEEAGFQVNLDKSFWQGPFRESCGGHYWRGVDVTPFYLKHCPDNLGDVITLANAIYLWCDGRNWADYRQFTPLVQLLHREVPRAFRGPLGVQGCLWSEWDECCPTWVRDFQSWKIRTVTRSSKDVDRSESSGAYLHKLWCETPELQASNEKVATGRWRSQVQFVDRNAWRRLAVRRA